MKLQSKLTLYTTLSKIAIVLLFIWLLPLMVKEVAFKYTNNYLKEQQNKVLENINKNGIDYYFNGDSSYGSYTMLKEEYISLEPVGEVVYRDTIETSQRIVESDTLTYRLLNHVFVYKNKKYVLEIGKTLAAINQYNRPLQKVALYVLAALVALTLIIDLISTRLLIRPLNSIINSKLIGRKFPFKEDIPPVKTTTTDFKYLDDSLIDLMHKIREAFEKEREFTSNASHELMTPIGILQNKVENLMMDSEMSEAAQDKVAGIMTTLNRLKKIVRSLLYISRIENEQFVKSDTVKSYSLVKEVITELEDRLEARGISVTQSVAQDITLSGINRDLIFQLVYNLVNNAIRYNKDSGTINITDKYLPGSDYRLVIEDSGIGMNPSDLENIFARFKKTSEVEGEGYGLGLSIVKTIATYHSLTIEVSSVKGSGSTFTIVFPATLIGRKAIS